MPVAENYNSDNNVDLDRTKGLYPRLFRAMGLRGQLPKHVPGHCKRVSSTWFRVPKGPLCQVFYPAQHDVSSKDYYLRRKCVNAMGETLGGRVGLSTVYKLRHHVLKDAPLRGEKLPMVVFSHGLLGHAEMYTVVCRDLASFGYIVVALEHEDASASYAESHDGKPIFYVPEPEGYVWTNREDCRKFRGPGLQQRLAEVDAVMDAFSNPQKQPDYTDLVQSLVNAADMDNVVMAGHSFGACTAYLASQQLTDDGRNRFKCSVLLDIWSFPLSDEAEARGLDIPVFSVLSEPFTDNEFTDSTKKLLAASKTHYSYYIPRSIHQSFSDTPWWAPNWLAKKLKLAGPKHRDVVHRAWITLVGAFMEGSLESVTQEFPPLATMAPKPEDKSGTVVVF